MPSEMTFLCVFTGMLPEIIAGNRSRRESLWQQAHDADRTDARTGITSKTLRDFRSAD